MQLKSLEIQGFKSFADKIKLNFTNGITAVVGPNGSGKSNISDAVRWVLGEQSTKTLRGSKMEDIIFNGTQIRKSQVFAKVSLIIDNSSRSLPMQTDEIIITRKLYRSGESEYRLNAVTVRLKDVYELFMDTGIGRDGYCIIGQGKIAEIVNAKSVQRREIFEEAAGISKYRYKKIETEKRLYLTQESLVRLKDIQIELENRVVPLKVQSEKAQQFITLSSEKKQLEVSLWIQTIENSKKLLREQQDKLTIAKQDHEASQEQLEQLEERIVSIFSTMQAYSLDVDSCRISVANKEAEKSKAFSDIAVFENTIYHNDEGIKKMQSEIQNFHENKKNMEERIGNKEEKIQIHKAQIATYNQQHLLLDNALQDVDTQIQTLCNQLSLFLNEEKSCIDTINEAKLRNMQSSSFLVQTTNHITNIQEEIRTKQAIVLKIQQEMKDTVDLIRILKEKIESNQNSLSGYQIKFNTKKELLDQLQLQKNEQILSEKSLLQKAKLIQDMENSMDGFANSVKLILNYAKNGTISGVFGTISQILSVEAEFTTAIEIVLGGAMQNIVVKDDFVAKQAIELLKQNKSGRATFLPLTAIKGHRLQEKEVEHQEGFIGFAQDLLTYDVEFSSVITSLLGRIVVVSTIDYAISMAKKYAYRFRIVTLDGQLINVGGSLTGGFIAKSTGLLSRRNEIIILNQQANAVQEAIINLSLSIKSIQEEQSFIDSQMLGIHAEIKIFNEDLFIANSEYKRLTIYKQDTDLGIATFIAELKKLEDALNDRSLNSVAEENSLENSIKEHEAMVKKCGMLEQEKISIQEKKDVLLKNKNQLKLDCLSLTKDLQALEIQYNDLLQQKQNASKGLEQLEIQKQALQYKNKEVLTEIATIKLKIEAIVKEITLYNQKIDVLYSKR
ncbi:MAG: chromosome segregation protein SMC, partial [Oscillospiraceae bacterium]